MKKELVIHYVFILSALVPPMFLALTWNEIPETIAVHYNYQLQPDRYDDKTSLIWIVAVICITSLLLYIILKNIHRFDPKRLNKPSSTFPMLAGGIIFFLSVLSMMIILSATKGPQLMENLLFPFLGLLFAFLGHFMGKLKPNYFAGIRIPWTLSDDENWKSTHQLAGKLWLYGGLAYAGISLLLPFKFMLILFMIMVASFILIPAIHSYRMFKRKNTA
jgi:uncharacterized membrane protein